ncbi:hypothetical protein AAFC00_005617 [Neodothiora populina]|uniref:Meiotic expression up-regulated protein 6 PH domain-containing protein n=1 Tax=Neodothiora populina TaxID=2781224 RepID=A0ABR3PMI6_9PEZI
MSAPEATTASHAAPADAPAVSEPAVAQPAETTTTAATEESPVAETAATTDAAVVAEDAPVAATELTEPKATEAAAAAETPAEETTTEGAVAETEAEPVKPVESGVLGYKAPGLIKSFKFSKKYFWLGEEPVSHEKLTTYLRGEKPEVAHSTAAWSSQTGKGLLYFAKHADDKANPAGVLNLSEAFDLEKHAPTEFSFKLNGHKHTFKSEEGSRDGWYVAIEQTMAEAKASQDTVMGSEGYKEALAHLAKPAVVVGGASAAVAGARKSVDTPKIEEPARAGSSSSSSDGEAAAKKKSKSKSRSVSRNNKRSSIFGSLLGRKEEHDAKKEVAKEEKAEEKAEDKEIAVEPVETPAAESSSTPAPLDAEAVAARATAEPAAEETKPAAETEPAVAAAKEDRPKAPSKRNSLFGFFEKVKSPSQEKKESEVAPVVPAKETAISAEPPVLPEPTSLETSAEPTVVEPVTPAAENAAKPEEVPTQANADKATTPKESRRKSYFGTQKISSLFRKPSQMRDNKKENVAPASEDKAPEVPAIAESSEVKAEDAPVETSAPATATETKAEETHASAAVPETIAPSHEQDKSAPVVSTAA